VAFRDRSGTTVLLAGYFYFSSIVESCRPLSYQGSLRRFFPLPACLEDGMLSPLRSWLWTRCASQEPVPAAFQVARPLLPGTLYEQRVFSFHPPPFFFPLYKRADTAVLLSPPWIVQIHDALFFPLFLGKAFPFWLETPGHAAPLLARFPPPFSPLERETVSFPFSMAVRPDFFSPPQVADAFPPIRPITVLLSKKRSPFLLPPFRINSPLRHRQICSFATVFAISTSALPPFLSSSPPPLKEAAITCFSSCGSVARHLFLS